MCCFSLETTVEEKHLPGGKAVKHSLYRCGAVMYPMPDCAISSAVVAAEHDHGVFFTFMKVKLLPWAFSAAFIASVSGTSGRPI